MRLPLGLATLCLMPLACSGSSGTNGKDGASANISVISEPAGSNCAHGGVAVKSSVGEGDVSTSYVCNGGDGQTLTAAAEPQGANCATGGVRVQVGSNDPMYLCNGTPGSNGQTVVATAEPAGANCAAGGLKVQVGSGSATYVCNGTAQSASIEPVPSSDTTSCPAGQGGIKVWVGSGSPSFICNGAPGHLTWATIDANTSSQANHAYIATGASPITLTLPASSALQVGDEIRLLVDGAGQVSVAPNAGQVFHYRRDELAPSTSWSALWGGGLSSTSLASSADGSKLVAAAQMDGIYTSSDSGANWTKTSAPALDWTGVASSADGVKLVAVSYALPSVSVPGAIYTSTDSGQTWTLTSAPNGASTSWLSVVSSADGTKLAAGTFDGIYVSADSGQTWTQQAAIAAWGPLACSPDGTKLVAAMAGGAALIYTSTDSGATWTKSGAPAGPGGNNWEAVALSADGTKLVAAAFSEGIYVSTDSGATWTKTGAPDGSWVSLASSADGSMVAALATRYQGLEGAIYTSTDSGATWTKNGAQNIQWRAVASSADGSAMVAVGQNGFYRRGSGALIAHPLAVLDLNYIGGGAFFVTEVAGTVEAP